MNEKRHHEKKDRREKVILKEATLTGDEINSRAYTLYNRLKIEYSRKINGHDYVLCEEYEAREVIAREAIEKDDYRELFEAADGKKKKPEALAKLILRKADNRRNKMRRFIIKIGNQRSLIRQLVKDGDLRTAQHKLEKFEEHVLKNKGDKDER